VAHLDERAAGTHHAHCAETVLPDADGHFSASELSLNAEHWPRTTLIPLPEHPIRRASELVTRAKSHLDKTQLSLVEHARFEQLQHNREAESLGGTDCLADVAATDCGPELDQVAEQFPELSLTEPGIRWQALGDPGPHLSAAVSEPGRRRGSRRSEGIRPGVCPVRHWMTSLL